MSGQGRAQVWKPLLLRLFWMHPRRPVPLPARNGARPPPPRRLPYYNRGRLCRTALRPPTPHHLRATVRACGMVGAVHERVWGCAVAHHHHLVVFMLHRDGCSCFGAPRRG